MALVPYAGAIAAAGLGVLGKYSSIVDRVFANYEATLFGPHSPVRTRGTDVLATPSPRRRRFPDRDYDYRHSPPRKRKRLFSLPGYSLKTNMPSRTATMVRNKRRRFKNASIGRLAYKKVRRLENQIEKKAFFQAGHNIALNVADSFTTMLTHRFLSAVPGGNTNITRVGNTISPRMLTINMCLRNGDANNSHCVRVVIVQAVGLDSTVTNYFNSDQAGTGASVVNNRFLAPKGNENQFRFRTLYDNIIALSAGTTNHFPIMLRSSKLKRVSFNGTAGADFQAGAIAIMLMRDGQSSTTDGTIRWDYQSKLTYTDA